jgi:hypothetical protein
MAFATAGSFVNDLNCALCHGSHIQEIVPQRKTATVAPNEAATILMGRMLAERIQTWQAEKIGLEWR